LATSAATGGLEYGVEPLSDTEVYADPESDES
jgi:hypothetical protein